MELPDPIDSFFTLCEDMHTGLLKYGAAKNIQQNTAVAFQGDLDALRKAQKNFKDSETAKTKASTNLTVTDSRAKAFLMLGRKIYAIAFGERWTEEWEATGFPDRKTAVPGTQAKRESLLNSTQTYLESNPDMEVNTTKVIFTSALAGTLFAALKKAREDAGDANVLVRQLKIERDAAQARMRKRMMGLIHELEQLLPADDPTWLAFGLPLPGATNLPDSPDALVLTAGQPGEVHGDWHNASRATYYRVLVMVVGVDETFVHKMNVHDSDCTLTGLPSGKKVRVQIISGNEAGYSEAIVAEIVVP